MSRFRRFEIIERSTSPSLFFKETSLFAPLPPPPTLNPIFSVNPFSSSSSSSSLFLIQNDAVDYALDLLAPSPLDDFNTISDLIHVQTTPFFTTTTTRRVKHHRPSQLERLDRLTQLARLHGESELGAELYLESLSDRVAALEQGLDKLVSEKKKPKPKKVGERKYTWTAEIKSPEEDGIDRKYKWTTEIKDGKKKGAPLDRSYKFTAEIKGKGEDSPIKRTYKFEASTGDAGDSRESKLEKKEKKKFSGKARVVEITEEPDQGALVLRQVFVY